MNDRDPAHRRREDPVLRRRARIAHVVSSRPAGRLRPVRVRRRAVHRRLRHRVHRRRRDRVIVVAIVAGSLVLAPAIVFGYAVKAADRDDREQAWD